MMQVVDLTPELEELYFVCLEDWSDELRECREHKARWYHKMVPLGLRVKVALDDAGTPGGMIHSLPVEHTWVEGHSLEFVLCTWVHGHKQGRGDFRGHGMGRALLAAAEADARESGALGMAAWGLALPIWMKARWYRKQGYRAADRDGIAQLVWKPFAKEAEPPAWVRPRQKPVPRAGQVTVTCLLNGWCPAQNLVYERARRAAEDAGARVAFHGIDTSEPDTFAEWGMSDALFVDGKAVRTGPPPSYASLRRRIDRRAARLPR